MPLRTLRLRWVHLLLGGALLMPYHLLTTVVIVTSHPGARPVQDQGVQFLAWALALPLVAATGCFPLVRSLESATARALCGVPEGAPAAGPAESWAARRRTAVWAVLHLGAGALVSGATLAVPPAVVVLLAYPFSPWLRSLDWGWNWVRLLGTSPGWAAPVAGLALLAGLLLLVHGAGALLARCSPVLLGPTPADRLAAAERRAADLASRNRLARELHDSVGHALGTVSLQAGAARRLLGTDPEFVREALAAIEDTSRSAVAELDAVLGVLRERAGTGDVPGPGAVRPPTLAAGLDGLLARSRATGTSLVLDTGDGVEPLDGLPAEASRAAFRIVQEGVGNALRHAPGQPVRVGLHRRAAPHGEELEIVLENPLPAVSGTGADAGHGGARRRAGSGLPGMAERARLLGGSAHAGAQGGVWLLTARLPLPAPDGPGSTR